MVRAAEAGITPEEFYRLTIGEIAVAIEGYHERERQSLISRVNAVVRGLSTLGKKKVDPYKGLIDKVRREATPGTLRKAAKAWLWQDE